MPHGSTALMHNIHTNKIHTKPEVLKVAHNLLSMAVHHLYVQFDTKFLQLPLSHGRKNSVKKFLDPESDVDQSPKSKCLLLVRHPTLQKNFTRIYRQFLELSANFVKMLLSCNGKIPFANSCIYITILIITKVSLAATSHTSHPSQKYFIKIRRQLLEL